MDINRVIDEIAVKMDINRESWAETIRGLGNEAWDLQKQKKSVREIQKILEGKRSLLNMRE